MPFLIVAQMQQLRKDSRFITKTMRAENYIGKEIDLTWFPQARTDQDLDHTQNHYNF